MPKVITANRLRDGVVVFLEAPDRWSEEIADARVADGEAAVAELEKIAERSVSDQSVISVYAMDVALEKARPRPQSTRERIRAAHAPTV